MRFLAGAVYILLLLSGSAVAFAQIDSATFSIRVFGGGDSEPPTTPTLLSAVPIAPSQIDITWTASTDNFIVGGYVVRRDGVPVATTTLTSYSDTGLTPSTTYAYEVQAFDAARNYSTSSNSISTTTPDVPPLPPPTITPTTTPSQATVARVVAKDITITPDYIRATIEISTVFPSRIEIRWGRTGSYELGYIETEALRKEHSTMITDLEPGTVYEYEVIGYTALGARTLLQQGKFTTLSAFDTLPPPNVLGFGAQAIEADVRLRWRLPTIDDIAYVRIVRSHLGFPLNPNDGAVVYQGLGIETFDRGVLSRYSPSYYTAFVYDTSGNISSGAVAIVYATTLPDRSDTVLDTEYGQVPIGQIPTEQPGDVATDVRMPQPFEIIISQRDRRYTFADELVPLHPSETTLISIDETSVAKYLKTIIVRLNDPTDQRITHSFLLRLNKDQTAYEAVVPPLGVAGASAVFVDIYDLENYIVANYRTAVMFTGNERQSRNGSFFSSPFTSLFVLLSSFLLLGLILFVVIRRLTEDNGR